MTLYKLGVDVGGTFTDLICVTPSGEVVLDKTPSTLDDQSTGVMNGIAQLAERFGLSTHDFCEQLELVVPLAAVEFVLGLALRLEHVATLIWQSVWLQPWHVRALRRLYERRQAPLAYESRGFWHVHVLTPDVAGKHCPANC